MKCVFYDKFYQKNCKRNDVLIKKFNLKIGVCWLRKCLSLARGLIIQAFFFRKTFDLGFPQFYCLFNPKKLIIKLKEAISQKKNNSSSLEKNGERLRSWFKKKFNNFRFILPPPNGSAYHITWHCAPVKCGDPRTCGLTYIKARRRNCRERFQRCSRRGAK